MTDTITKSYRSEERWFLVSLAAVVAGVSSILLYFIAIGLSVEAAVARADYESRAEEASAALARAEASYLAASASLSRDRALAEGFAPADSLRYVGAPAVAVR